MACRTEDDPSPPDVAATGQRGWIHGQRHSPEKRCSNDPALRGQGPPSGGTQEPDMAPDGALHEGAGLRSSLRGMGITEVRREHSEGYFETEPIYLGYTHQRWIEVQNPVGHGS